MRRRDLFKLVPAAAIGASLPAAPAPTPDPPKPPPMDPALAAYINQRRLYDWQERRMQAGMLCKAGGMPEPLIRKYLDEAFPRPEIVV